MKPWLNPSANQCTKASSEILVRGSATYNQTDLFNFLFILTRHGIDQNSANHVASVRMKGKLNQSDLITCNRSTQQDSEEAFVH